MDIKDLMVGDWVSVSGKSVKITKDDLATMLIFLDDDSKINPIDLTEEILVKNGWRKESITIDGDYANWHGEIPIYQEEDEFNYERIELTYVHQLQHLLRLCGIDKEIELCTN